VEDRRPRNLAAAGSCAEKLRQLADPGSSSTAGGSKVVCAAIAFGNAWMASTFTYEVGPTGR
jgi:hypothetical protein